MTFNDMVQEQRDKRIGKATSTDMRDAEIFGQLADLFVQISVKNKKNFVDMMHTEYLQRNDPDRMAQIFERAKHKAEEGSNAWWE